MQPDAKTIEKLKAEYGEIYLVSAAGVSVIIRPPSREAFRRFNAMAARESQRYEALETLVRDCVVWPGQAELSALLEKKPGLVAPIAEKAIELAGAVQEVEFRPL